MMKSLIAIEASFTIVHLWVSDVEYLKGTIDGFYVIVAPWYTILIVKIITIRHTRFHISFSKFKHNINNLLIISDGHIIKSIPDAHCRDNFKLYITKQNKFALLNLV